MNKDSKSQTEDFVNGVNTCEIRNGAAYANAFALQKLFFDFVVPFQVTEISSDSITINTTKIIGKFLSVREVDGSWSTPPDGLTSDMAKALVPSNYFEHEGIYRIDNLKSNTYYNILIGTSEIKEQYTKFLTVRF